MASAGQGTHSLYRGTNDAQHAPMGVELRKVMLLNGAQRLGRSRITGQDDQVTAFLEERFNALQGVLIDYIKRSRAVRGARIVA